MEMFSKRRNGELCCHQISNFFFIISFNEFYLLRYKLKQITRYGHLKQYSRDKLIIGKMDFCCLNQ